MLRSTLRVCLLWTFFGSALACGEELKPVDLDPQLPYQAERSNPVTYEVDYSIIVTAPYKTKRLQVWLPLASSDVGQDVEERTLATFPMRVEPAIASETRFGNRFAYFEFKEPQGAQIIRQQFRVTVWELRWNLDAEKLSEVKRWPAAFDRYRQGDSQGIIVDARLESVLREIVPRNGNGLRDLDKVLTWVNDNFEYDHADASLRADSTHGLQRRRGHCSDYHSFCAALGRAMGHPTRVTYGINTFPKSSPSHCKLEAYLPPYGWVSFDVSETQKLTHELRKSPALSAEDKQVLSAAAHRRLIRGFRDNTWFAQTRGTDYDLVPKASGRVSVVRTIYAEADGVPLPDPDPANKEQTRFAWMTSQEFIPDRPVAYPFSDWNSLKSERD
ncbi:MAG: transglutaminase-like domain-containing protein [Planctomycetales bacterium]